MSTATLSSPYRTIAGMNLERMQRRGFVRWSATRRRPPVERPSYSPETGRIMGLEHAEVDVIFDRTIDPRAEWGSLVNQLRLEDLDPREPSPLHEQLERARAAGFAELAEAFTLAARVKARPPIAGMELGRVQVSYGCRRARCTDAELRGYLERHARGDWGEHGTAADVGELSEDQQWAPVVFGQAVVNKHSLDAPLGVVRSVFKTEADPPGPPISSFAVACRDDRRRSELIHIGTFKDQGWAETLVWCPRLDVV